MPGKIGEEIWIRQAFNGPRATMARSFLGKKKVGGRSCSYQSE